MSTSHKNPLCAMNNVVQLAPITYFCPRCGTEKLSPTGEVPRGWGEHVYTLQVANMRGGLCEVCAPIVDKLVADLGLDR